MVDYFGRFSIPRREGPPTGFRIWTESICLFDNNSQTNSNYPESRQQ